MVVFGALTRDVLTENIEMLRVIVLAASALVLLGGRPAFAETGIVLLAHGGRADWNARVAELAAQVDARQPTEVAFGMATRANIQGAIDRLAARGVSEIVAVPLFVSSWSSVITSTEYLLGLRDEPPAALAVFAKMKHGHSTPATTNGSNGHGSAHGRHGTTDVGVDGTTPVISPVPVRMTPALNDHPLVADILASRARSVSRTPAGETVVIVAHGPNDEDDNRRWLADMASLAAQLRRGPDRFAAIEYLTLRDDAPEPVRDAATVELRAMVARHTTEGRRVLIVPLLVSFGGIEKGLRERLAGLEYVMPDAGLVPDARLVDWVLARAAGR